MANKKGPREPKPRAPSNEPGAAGHRASSRHRAAVSVPTPSALERALREHADARAHWQKLAPSHRKEYVTWITSARRSETADRRVALAVEKLCVGAKTPMRANDAPAVSAAPLGKKLGIKPDTRVVVVAAPDTERPHIDRALPGGPADLVVAFARDTEDLGRIAPRALAALAPEGILWIAYRKKAPGVKSDLSRDRGWDVVTSAGWQAVSLVAIDSAWSALRFKNAGR